MRTVLQAALTCAALAVSGCQTPASKPAEAASRSNSSVSFGSDVVFDVDRDDLGPDAQLRLSRVLEVVRSRRLEVIILEGHADQDETSNSTESLPARRAEAVKRFFVVNGVDASRIKVIVSVDPSASRLPGGRNRRVEIEVVGRPIGQAGNTPNPSFQRTATPPLN